MDAPADDSHAQAAALHEALVHELMRKSSLCWVRLPGAERDRPVWHVWHEGAAYVVTGGSEQPLPGVEEATEAVVVVRAKDTRQRMLAWRAAVEQVDPDHPGYDAVVGELLGARLNLPDLAEARERWDRECRVTRLRPTGALAERPEDLPDGDLATPPAPTPATTRRGLPRVLHRRQTRRPRLD